MLRRKRLRIGIPLVAAAAVLAFASYAFTAANTVPPSSAGSGSGAITGYTISGIGYTLDNTTPTNLDAVTFTITPAAASQVKVQLAAGGAWYTCANAAGSVTCNTTSPQATVAGATTLTVVSTN
jgi:hypothetical protein